jgi:hypothetical protein
VLLAEVISSARHLVQVFALLLSDDVAFASLADLRRSVVLLLGRALVALWHAGELLVLAGGGVACLSCGGGGVEMRVRRWRERGEVEMVRRSGHVLLHILLLSITLLLK